MRAAVACLIVNTVWSVFLFLATMVEKHLWYVCLREVGSWAESSKQKNGALISVTAMGVESWWVSVFVLIIKNHKGEASWVGQLVKNPPAMQETLVQLLDWEDPLEEGKATHSSILPWESHGQRSLAGYSPQSLKESDTTGWLSTVHKGEKTRGILSISTSFKKPNLEAVSPVEERASLG